MSSYQSGMKFWRPMVGNIRSIMTATIMPTMNIGTVCLTAGAT